MIKMFNEWYNKQCQKVGKYVIGGAILASVFGGGMLYQYCSSKNKLDIENNDVITVNGIKHKIELEDNEATTLEKIIKLFR